MTTPFSNKGFVLFSIFILLISSLILLFPSQVKATNLTLDENLGITDNNVDAMVTDGNDLYIGGTFTYVGPNTGYGTVVTENGTLDGDWPLIYGQVNCVIPDGQGGWYVGGSFQKVGTYDRVGIVHINPDKTVDSTFNPNPVGAVNALAISGSDLYVGGAFASIGGQPRLGIAKLNTTDGSADAAFNANPNNVVTKIAISGSNLYVAGDFTSIGGLSRSYIAKLNTTDGSADATFNANTSGPFIFAITISGSDLYVGGFFTSIGGQSRNNIAKLSATDGSADGTFNPNASFFVFSIAVSGPDLYVGGAFSSIGGQSRNNIAKLSATDGSADGTFDPDADNAISTISISDSNLYVGGYFTSIGGESRNKLAKLNTTTGAAESTFNLIASSTVQSTAISGTNLFVGGLFKSIGGQLRNKIAKLSTTTGSVDATFNPNANGNIFSLAISGSDLYVGGGFSSIGGQSRNRIAKLNTTTGLADATFNPDANNNVSALLVSGQDLYVGGSFTSIGGQSRNRIAKLSATSGLADGGFDPNSNGPIETLSLSGSDLYVGGGFSSIGGQSRNDLAKLNTTDGSADATFNPNSDGSVNAIAVSGSDLYAGGYFDSIGGQSRENFAKLNTTTGTADDSFTSDANNGVFAIAVRNSDLYVGGQFGTIGGQQIGRIAKLDTTTGVVDTTFDLEADSSGNVYSLSLTDSELFIGGSFQYFGRFLPSLARYVVYTHSITLDNAVLNASGTSADISGSVSTSNSVTNISEVQYNVGSNSPNGTWTACTASDGSFNSTSESFSCSVSDISSPGQIVYVRAYDVNTSYTAQSNYGEVSVLVDSVSDLTPSSYTNDSSPTLSFHKTAYSSGISSYDVHLDNDKNRNFSTSGLPASGDGSSFYVWKDDDDVRVEYLHEDDSDTGNDLMKVYFKDLGSNPLTEGKHSWHVTALNQNNNSSNFSTDFYLDLTSPTLSNLKINGVTRTGSADIASRKVYRLTSSTRYPFFTGTVSDKYQGSERTNDNGSEDTFDAIASGPDKIILTLKKWTKGSRSAPIYEDYLREEFTLTDIQDDNGNQKTAGFNITLSQELENGSYETIIEAEDQAGNIYTQDSFYILLNSQGPMIGGISQQDLTLDTRIIEEKAIEKETEEEIEGLIVQIKVVDDDNKPVEGVKVTLYSDPLVAFTDNQGIATFNNVAKGEHTAVIEYDGKIGEQDITVGNDDNIKEYHFTIEVKEKKQLTIEKYGIPAFILLILLIGVILIVQRKKRSEG